MTARARLAVLGAMMCFVAPTLNADPPSRAGRLALMTGTVSIRPAGDSEWAAATPNRPLTTGDRVWTDTNSRAEIQIGSTVLRLSSQTEVDILNLDDQTLQVSIPQGTVTTRVRRLDSGQGAELDTPNSAVEVGGAGEYRIDVSPDGTKSTIEVWGGGVTITSAGSSFQLKDKQVATINGTDAPTYEVTDLGAPDAWDQWVDGRDHRTDASASAQYVSPEVGGYEDLDDYGTWRDDPTYGAVWVPTRVEPTWVPYHYGHWVWTGPWGWTWVDDAPWGWAPFHYGRWAYIDDRWAWCPGRVYARPVYAPALVAFVGGSRWNVSGSFGAGGGVGWFPLAPEEVWYPPYHVTNVYVRNVNYTNVTNVTNITYVTNVTNVNYRNRAVPGAFVAVPRNAFQNGAPVYRSAVRVPAADIARAPYVGAAPIVPNRRSLVPVVSQHRPPATIVNRPVMARRSPPASVPFDAQQKALAAHPGRPVSSTQLQTLRRAAPPPRSPCAPPPHRPDPA